MNLQLFVISNTSIFDSIFSNNDQTLTWVNWFDLPFLQTNITEQQRQQFITLSDHEPVFSTVYFKKWT